MVHGGFVKKNRYYRNSVFPCGSTDFSAAIEFKVKVFTRAYERFQIEKTDLPEFPESCRNHAGRLEDFALFSTSHLLFNGNPWDDWPEEIKYREPATQDAMQESLETMIRKEKFFQYLILRIGGESEKVC